MIKKGLCNFNYTNIAFYVSNADALKQVLPFTLNMLTNKAITIEQLLLFRRLCTKQLCKHSCCPLCDFVYPFCTTCNFSLSSFLYFSFLSSFFFYSTFQIFSNIAKCHKSNQVHTGNLSIKQFMK